MKGNCFVFHWSNADVSVIKKSMFKYPGLNDRFMKIHGTQLKFVDLMKVFKNSCDFDSYSLKQVAKLMLGYEYDSDCKNGFDAMMTTIDHFVIENQNEKKQCLSDIIYYNKIDTKLLLDLINAVK
jgi:predicted RecB family nuclease